MNMRKAQAVTLVSITGLGLVATGTFLGAITLTDTLTETVQVNSGDVPVIMETRIKEQHYSDRMPYSMKYAYNTATYRITERFSGRTWTSDSPTQERIKGALRDEFRERISERNMIAGCQPPTVESVSIDKEEAALETGGEIICRGSNTEVEMPAPDKIQTGITQNGFLGNEPSQVGGSVIWSYGILRGSLYLNEQIEEQVSQEEFTESKVGECGESYESIKESVRQTTSSEASDFYSPSDVDVGEVERNLLESLSADISSVTVSGNHDSEQISSTQCQESCEPLPGGDGCLPVYDQKLTVEDTYTATGLDWDVNLEDSRAIVTREGERTLELDYVYSQSFSD